MSFFCRKAVQIIVISAKPEIFEEKLHLSFSFSTSWCSTSQKTLLRSFWRKVYSKAFEEILYSFEPKALPCFPYHDSTCRENAASSCFLAKKGRRLAWIKSHHRFGSIKNNTQDCWWSDLRLTWSCGFTSVKLGKTFRKARHPTPNITLTETACRTNAMITRTC